MFSISRCYSLISCIILLQTCLAPNPPPSGNCGPAVPEETPLCDMKKYKKLQEIYNMNSILVEKVQERKTKNIFVLKTSLPISSTQPPAGLRNEISILKRIKGTSVTGDIHCVGKDEMFYIMEYLEGKPLDQCLLKGSCDLHLEGAERLLFFATKMVETIVTLHINNIVHLDAHPGNWIFNPKTQHIRLIDYGEGRDLNDETETNKNELKMEDDDFIEGTWRSMYDEMVTGGSPSFSEVLKVLNAKKFESSKRTRPLSNIGAKSANEDVPGGISSHEQKHSKSEKKGILSKLKNLIKTNPK